MDEYDETGMWRTDAQENQRPKGKKVVFNGTNWKGPVLEAAILKI